MDDTIGKRLKHLRIENNFTKKQLANYLNLKESQISDLEINKLKLSHKNLIKLSKLYYCSPNYILNGGGYSKTIVNNECLDLETIADMNTIINNLEFLSRISKT